MRTKWRVVKIHILRTAILVYTVLLRLAVSYDWSHTMYYDTSKLACDWVISSSAREQALHLGELREVTRE